MYSCSSNPSPLCKFPPLLVSLTCQLLLILMPFISPPLPPETLNSVIGSVDNLSTVILPYLFSLVLLQTLTCNVFHSIHFPFPVLVILYFHSPFRFHFQLSYSSSCLTLGGSYTPVFQHSNQLKVNPSKSIAHKFQNSAGETFQVH